MTDRPVARRRPVPTRLSQQSDDATDTAGLDDDARRALAAEQGAGQPLPDGLRREHEQRSGADLSDVRVHTSSTTAGLAHGMHARAFTSGADVYLAPGEYRPGSVAGQALLAHELSHVVEQSTRGTPVVQRLIRTPFPWAGVVTAAAGANLCSTPDSTDPSNVIVALLSGTHLNVIGSTGVWLHVQHVGSGGTTTGYMHHTLVDDATSAAMQQMVGTKMEWHGSGQASGTTFQVWAAAATEVPFPAITSTTVMNCWEAVMLAAYRAGVLSWARIHAIYTASGSASGWVGLLAASRRTYVRGGASAPPQRGDLVFFDGMNHVALATGNGDQVYSFWPAPDTPFAVAGATPDRVKLTTIADIVTWWSGNLGGTPKVEIGAPSW